MPWRRFCKTCWRLLQNVLKTSWQDVLKTSWKYLQDVLKTYDEDEYIDFDQDVLKTSSRCLLKTRLRRTHSSWWRSLEDEDERRLLDVFKTSSLWRMFAGYLAQKGSYIATYQLLDLVVPNFIQLAFLFCTGWLYCGWLYYNVHVFIQLAS